MRKKNKFDDLINSPKKEKDVNWWIKKVWDVFRRFIYKRDGNTCISCGKTNLEGRDRQAGHYVPVKDHNNTRFDEENVNVQCSGCNKWMYGNLTEYGVRLDEKWGDGTAKKLTLKGRILKQFTVAELKELYEKYKKLI